MTLRTLASVPSWLPLALLLASGCARAPDPEDTCPDTRSPFRHRGLVPVAPPPDGSDDGPEDGSGDDLEIDLRDHDHGHAHQDTAVAWAPGQPAIGAVHLARGAGRLTTSDGWRPARSVDVVAPWSMVDAPPEAFADPVAAARLATVVRSPGAGVALWWDGSEAPPAGTREVAGAAAALAELLGDTASARCVDALCAAPRRDGGLALVSLEGGRLDGVVARWAGDGATLRAFLEAVRAPREGRQKAELGEVLSIEEGLRLEEAARRLRRLAPLAPDNPFIRYFLARNAAGRGDHAAALAGLASLRTQPTARALAARVLAERDAEWEPLRGDPRYAAAQAGLMRAIPKSANDFAAWLLRHRASPPHLEVAVLPGGPAWPALALHLEAAALLPLRPPRPRPRPPESLVWDTPRGPLTLRLGRDPDGLPGVVGIDTPSP